MMIMIIIVTMIITTFDSYERYGIFCGPEAKSRIVTVSTISIATSFVLYFSSNKGDIALIK